MGQVIDLIPILPGIIIRIKRQTVRRITSEILGVKGWTLFSQVSTFIFSILFFIYSYGTDKENLFTNQELLKPPIISFILMTLMFDSAG